MKKCTHKIFRPARLSTDAASLIFASSLSRVSNIFPNPIVLLQSRYQCKHLKDRGFHSKGGSATAGDVITCDGWNQLRHYSTQSAAESSTTSVPRQRTVKKKGVKKEVFSYSDFMATDIKTTLVPKPVSPASIIIDTEINDAMTSKPMKDSQTTTGCTDVGISLEDRGAKPLSLMEQIRKIMDDNSEHVVLTEVGSFYEVSTVYLFLFLFFLFENLFIFYLQRSID